MYGYLVVATRIAVRGLRLPGLAFAGGLHAHLENTAKSKQITTTIHVHRPKSAYVIAQFGYLVAELLETLVHTRDGPILYGKVHNNRLYD